MYFFQRGKENIYRSRCDKEKRSLDLKPENLNFIFRYVIYYLCNFKYLFSKYEPQLRYMTCVTYLYNNNSKWDSALKVPVTEYTVHCT